MSHRAKLCVVDDDREAAALLCAGLSLHDYEAVEALSGQAALEICEEGDIDMVLLDVRIPRMSGLEVCQAIRAEPGIDGTPIIFLSVQSAEREIIDGLKRGADDYITKPFDSEEVLARVSGLFRKLGKEAPGQ